VDTSVSSRHEKDVGRGGWMPRFENEKKNRVVRTDGCSLQERSITICKDAWELNRETMVLKTFSFTSEAFWSTTNGDQDPVRRRLGMNFKNSVSNQLWRINCYTYYATETLKGPVIK
jgi:hypothetical protein